MKESRPMAPTDEQMREAGARAAALIAPGMCVGLGTGRTVAWLLRAMAERGLTDLRCVATSPETEQAASALGIPVEPFNALDRLDIAIDGADQVAQDRWTIKGGHGAHLREKIVAVAAERFVVIVSAEKLVKTLRPPIPLELRPFGLRATLRAVGEAKLRPDAPASPDGGVLADYLGAITEPAALASHFDQIPGVSGHGLFSPSLVHDVVVGGGDH
jgi:ribose 5-phosphate isomerase A